MTTGRDAIATAPQRVGAEPLALAWKQQSGLIGLSIVNFILRILTLGIYHFWGKTEVRRRIWSAVRLNGEPLEYTGTGKELFIGFLVATAANRSQSALSLLIDGVKTGIDSTEAVSQQTHDLVQQNIALTQELRDLARALQEHVSQPQPTPEDMASAVLALLDPLLAPVGAAEGAASSTSSGSDGSAPKPTAGSERSERGPSARDRPGADVV